MHCLVFFYTFSSLTQPPSSIVSCKSNFHNQSGSVGCVAKLQFGLGFKITVSFRQAWLLGVPVDADGFWLPCCWFLFSALLISIVLCIFHWYVEPFFFEFCLVQWDKLLCQWKCIYIHTCLMYAWIHAYVNMHVFSHACMHMLCVHVCLFHKSKL